MYGDEHSFLHDDPSHEIFVWLEQKRLEKTFHALALNQKVTLRQPDLAQICKTLRLRQRVDMKAFDPPHSVGFMVF